MTKLLFLAGSARKDSINKKLAKNAADIATSLGAEATFIDLKDFDMPIYNGDIEDATGLPENAKKLKTLFQEADGFFIASPEYNSSFSPLLKNSLDWISRKGSPEEASLSAYSGKVAALGATSQGALGGLRGLVSLRSMLGNIGVFVTPTQVAVGKAGEAFDETGKLKDTKLLTAVVKELLETATKLKK